MKNSQDLTQQNSFQFQTHISFWSRSWSFIDELKNASDEKIINAIAKTSERYQSSQQMHKSPWHDIDFQLSYLAYFMPLNALRLESVLLEARERNFFSDINTVLDFGSGCGTFHYAYMDLLDKHKTDNPLPEIKKWIFIENENRATQIHKKLLSAWNLPITNAEWLTQSPKISPALTTAKNSLGVFSYSLNEIHANLESIPDLESLLIIEPSTQNWGRRLQELRAQLISKGYYLWAPCVHQEACPLLTQSKSDWCHHRIHIELPKELQKIHERLPIKNKSLTYSYLLAKKIPPPKVDKMSRVIGDTLFERGKIRQAICRNSDREFLSWLTKHGEPEIIPRGTLLPIDFEFEKKGDELRVIPLQVK
jgi:ribosomal protein RSM22 (predicted rRNA methylase)